MDEIYIVTRLYDAEYCGREIEKVFANREDAEAYVQEQVDEYYDGNNTFETWKGHKFERYSVESWEVNDHFCKEEED